MGAGSSPPAKKLPSKAAAPAKDAPASQPLSPGQKALAAYIARTKARVGILAVNLKDGKALAAADSEVAMIPASVHKLTAAAVALVALGADFRFTTTLAVVGESPKTATAPAAGPTDLLVVGDGDPTFGDPRLAEEQGGTIYDVMDAWAAKLKELKLTSFKGRLLLDDSLFQSGRHADWPRDQASGWYAAPASPLTFNDNCLDVLVRKTGASAEAEVSPASRYITVVNRLTVGKGNTWSVRYGSGDATVTLVGQVNGSSGRPISVAVNDPAMLFGRVLADRLERAGVRVEGGIARVAVAGERGRLPAGARVIAQQATPIGQVLSRANKHSLNLAAECLLLRAAAERRGRASFDDAAGVATGLLVNAFNLDEKQFVVADGCGFSRRDRLSPRAAVTLLARLAEGPDAQVFLPSLPVGGVDGTLDDRFKGHPGRVLGKTGTIAGVSTLAGYVLDKQGSPAIAFAVFCNYSQGSAAEAHVAQDALVTDWLEALDAGAAPSPAGGK